jgi:magnesium chelatase subunit D
MLTQVARNRPLEFPFTALVGLEGVKEALILNAINPKLGGVLIFGEKGTGKSAIVRALAELLPEIEVVQDCPYSCSPYIPQEMCDDCYALWEKKSPLPTFRRKVRVVELPLGATEDRVVGGVDFQLALKRGERQVDPGILAFVNRGILYVDEINLLDDHLVNLLLDAAATGVNFIEREGISFRHPAKFILIGTMNPEEGELRPQLLDRFGMCVEVKASLDLEERVNICRYRQEFDEAPQVFYDKWAEEQYQLREKIIKAQELLKLDKIYISPQLMAAIIEISLANGVAGHRADILMANTAKTIAAFQGRSEVIFSDLTRAAQLILPHRARPERAAINAAVVQNKPSNTAKKSPADPDQVEEGYFDDSQEPIGPQAALGHDRFTKTDVYTTKPSPIASKDSSPITFRVQTREDRAGDQIDQELDEQGTEGTNQIVLETFFPVGQPFKVRPLILKKDHYYRMGSGRRTPTRTLAKSGRYIRSTTERRNDDLALDATIRAASPYQTKRAKRGVAIAIEEGDIREKIRERKTGNLLVFIVDASGSMGEKLMIESKGAIMSLLFDAYQKRDKVSLVAFRETTADVLLPPTDSIELAKKLLEDLPTGGRTPLGQGLICGYQVIKNYLRKDRKASPLLILVSDGRANVGLLEGKCPPNYYALWGFAKIKQEILNIARHIRADEHIKSLVIDVSEGWSPNRNVRDIAEAMGAQYTRVQHLKATGIIEVVKRHF